MSISPPKLFIATVYRSSLLTEFPESDLADNIHIFGDFNISVGKSADPFQKAFGAINDSVAFVSHVSGPREQGAPTWGGR
jgi:hypothetical protein